MEENINSTDEKEKDLFHELRNHIVQKRDEYQNQIHGIKDKLEKMAKEKEMLETLKLKLEGAVEASNLYAKAVLPSNNSK